MNDVFQLTNDSFKQEQLAHPSSTEQNYSEPKKEIQEHKTLPSQSHLAFDERNNTPKDSCENTRLADAEKERQKCIERWMPELLQKLQLYSYDEESEAFFWPLIDKISSISTSIMSEMLSKIVINHFDSPNVLCAVAVILSSFDLTEISNIGPIIMMALLSNKNETVKEYAVILLDNWEDPSLLPLFKSFDCSSVWLKSYLKRVICNLEK